MLPEFEKEQTYLSYHMGHWVTTRRNLKFSEQFPISGLSRLRAAPRQRSATSVRTYLHPRPHSRPRMPIHFAPIFSHRLSQAVLNSKLDDLQYKKTGRPQNFSARDWRSMDSMSAFNFNSLELRTTANCSIQTNTCGKPHLC